MPRLSRTSRVIILAVIAVSIIALLQVPHDIGTSSGGRDQIRWRMPQQSSVLSEETREFELSNESCPPGLPLLEATQVDSVDLELSLFLDLPRAISLVFLNDNSGFVAERNGRVYAFESEKVSAEPVINLASNTSTDMDQGLLGLAVSPDKKWLYLNRTDLSGSSVVTAHSLTSGISNLGNGVEIIIVDQPSAMHKSPALPSHCALRFLPFFPQLLTFNRIQSSS